MKRTEVYSLIKSGDYAKAIELLSTAVKEPGHVSGPASAFSALADHCFDKKESFFVLTLDGSHHIIAAHTITTGLVNRTIVHPREVFQPAITDNACAIIVAHNHPSGHLEPSSEDCDLTRRLVDAGQLMGIPVLDHIILGKNRAAPSYISLNEISGHLFIAN